MILIVYFELGKIECTDSITERQSLRKKLTPEKRQD